MGIQSFGNEDLSCGNLEKGAIDAGGTKWLQDPRDSVTHERVSGL